MASTIKAIRPGWPTWSCSWPTKCLGTGKTRAVAGSSRTKKTTRTATRKQRHDQPDGQGRPRHLPTGRERPVPKKSKMPGLVKVAEKRDHARIARLTASVPSELARDVGFPLSRGWSPLECALYLAQMMPPKDRSV